MLDNFSLHHLGIKWPFGDYYINLVDQKLVKDRLIEMETFESWKLFVGGHFGSDISVIRIM